MTELPGADLVREGIADLERGVESIPALLVSIGAPRLARAGIDADALPFRREDATIRGLSAGREIVVVGQARELPQIPESAPSADLTDAAIAPSSG